MPYEKSNKEIQNKRAGFKMKYQGDKSAFPFKFQNTIGGRPLKSGPAPERKVGKKLKDTEVGKFVSGLVGSIFGGGKYKGEKSLGGQVKNVLTKGNKGKTTDPKPATIVAPNTLGGGAGIGELSGKPKTSKLGTHTPFKPVVKKGAKGDPYTYRTKKGGGYEFQKKGDKGWTTAKSKKGIAAISKLFGK